MWNDDVVVGLGGTRRGGKDHSWGKVGRHWWWSLIIMIIKCIIFPEFTLNFLYITMIGYSLSCFSLIYSLINDYNSQADIIKVWGVRNLSRPLFEVAIKDELRFHKLVLTSFSSLITQSYIITHNQTFIRQWNHFA